MDGAGSTCTCLSPRLKHTQAAAAAPAASQPCLHASQIFPLLLTLFQGCFSQLDLLPAQCNVWNATKVC